MRRFFILLLVVLMPLKVLAASFGMCSQVAATHGQQHHAQEGQAVQSAHQHTEVQLLNGQQTKAECSNCQLCHTACGTFVLMTGDGLSLPSISSQTLPVDLAVSMKAQPSDPPYRPKWPALAELASVLVIS